MYIAEVSSMHTMTSFPDPLLASTPLDFWVVEYEVQTREMNPGTSA